MIDNSPRIRQAKKLARKQGKRLPAQRILIVSEGTKTEPHYFEDIRITERLPTLNVKVLHSNHKTESQQVVSHAEKLFIKGDEDKKIKPRSFEKVYAIFDRDSHLSYYQALEKAKAINQQKLRNDEGKAITFEAIVSVPCFELWLLLHFEQCLTPLHRDDALEKVKNYLKNYEKGQSGYYQATKDYLETANAHAKILEEQYDAWDGVNSYTNIHQLVDRLIHLKP